MSKKYIKSELVGNNAGGVARLISQGSYEKKNAQGFAALKPAPKPLRDTVSSPSKDPKKTS